MAIKANAIVSLAEAQAHIGNSAPTPADDLRVEKWVNRASSFAEGYCRRKFVTGTYTEYFDGRRGNRIMPKHWPIVGGPAAGGTKPELSYDPDSLFPSGSEQPVNDYFVSDMGTSIELARGLVAPKGWRNIRLVYDAGYGTIAGDDLPEDLKHAVLEMILWYEVSNSNTRVGTKQKSKRDENVTYEQTVPGHVTLLLEKYIRCDINVGDSVMKNV